MKINKIIAIIATFGTINSYAGVTALTHHSRANCLGINESISWQLGVKHILKVYGTHYKLINGAYIKWHQGQAGTSSTWRQAVVCLHEVTSGTYKVHGDHYVLNPNNSIKEVWDTDVTDCSIYDGWWDSDHAERRS